MDYETANDKNLLFIANCLMMLNHGPELAKNDYICHSIRTAFSAHG
jgi:hypothetical protein